MYSRNLVNGREVRIDENDEANSTTCQSFLQQMHANVRTQTPNVRRKFKVQQLASPGYFDAHWGIRALINDWEKFWLIYTHMRTPVRDL